MQRYSHLGYLCMCQPYRGAQNHPWRYHGGAYGLHVPHSGEAQKLPFLDTGNFHKRQVPKKEIFGPPPNGGRGARMRPQHISRGVRGHPPIVHTCRDMGTRDISACVSPTGVGKMTPGDVMEVHTGSMPPIRGRPKNCLFWPFGNFQKRQVPKKAIFGPPPNGGHGARMRPPYISRGVRGHPPIVHTCRDMGTRDISACVSPTGVGKMTPRDLRGVHMGSMSPIQEDKKISFFGHLEISKKGKCQKRQFLCLPRMGDMEPVWTPIRSPGVFGGTRLVMTHAEIQPFRLSLHVSALPGCPKSSLEISWRRIRAPCPPSWVGPKIAFFGHWKLP